VTAPFSGVPQGPALPFGGARGFSAPMTSSVPKGTAGPGGHHPDGPSLPFRAGVPSPRQVETPTSSVADASAIRIGVPSPGALGTGTSFLPDSLAELAKASSGSRARPTLPFTSADVPVAATDVDLSQFPIERYAAVSAALANGEPRADVLRRNVLTHTMWLALAQAWAERFTREPTLAEQYRALVARARNS
jgi:hypothetical protein